jgi:pyruvate dehydrogenase E1 component beta subunit
VGAGYSAYLAEKVADSLKASYELFAEVVDIRVINPLDPSVILNSVEKTGKLVVLDGGWRTCGLAAEIIASVSENISLTHKPLRITLPDAPAPTSKVLESIYYPNVDTVISAILKSSLLEF